jgi:8-oxo-dGTP pyrophosphatase MutT (NUDIX family)
MRKRKRLFSKLERSLARTAGRVPGVGRLARTVARRRAGVHHVAVVAVVLSPDVEVLLAQHEFRGSGWALPGGWVRPHEHPTDAVVREIREEFGFAVSVYEVVASESHVEASGGAGASGITIAFRCGLVPPFDALRTPFDLSLELRDARWSDSESAKASLSRFEGHALDVAISFARTFGP